MIYIRYVYIYIYMYMYMYIYTLDTSCEELTHWKRLWCWEGLGAGGEGDDRGWDGWMASLTRWTWVWVNSGRWWWTERPGMLRFMGSQRVRHYWATELNWTEDHMPLFCGSCHKYNSVFVCEAPSLIFIHLSRPYVLWEYRVSSSRVIIISLQWILCLAHETVNKYSWIYWMNEA